jgi:bifunctional non-homologous end joining protein LigD
VRGGPRRAAPLPPFRAQLALLVDRAPEGGGWLHEVKYDGYRIGCAIASGRARLWSRNGNDWTARFAEVAAAASVLPVEAALLDGEVTALLPDGRTSFQALQGAASAGTRPVLAYFVFDLLHLDGEELARRPLVERKAALARLLGARGKGVLRLAPHVVGGGGAAFREACRRGLEGIVSKRADEPYRPGRSGAWVKTKCLLRQELVVGGFTEPVGAAREGLGALLLGFHAGGALRYAGKVGTGFTNPVARALRARLEGLRTPECPFSPAPARWRGGEAIWVRPVLVAEVSFTEWTTDDKVRHPSFQGLREDKRAEDVVRERAAPSSLGSWPGSGSARAATSTGTGAASSTRRGSRRRAGSSGTRRSSTRSS